MSIFIYISISDCQIQKISVLTLYLKYYTHLNIELPACESGGRTPYAT